MPEEKKAEQASETPEVKDTKSMSLDELRQHILNNPETEDKSEDASNKTEEQESTEDDDKSSTEEQPEETVEQESTEEADKSVTEDNPENQVEESETKKQLEQTLANYKELQRQFTQDRQEMKAMKEKLAILESLKKPESAQESALEALKKTNPEGAAVLEKAFAEQRAALQAEFEAKLKEHVQPLKDGIETSVVVENVKQFQTKVDDFLKGEFKELEQEVTKVINSNKEHYEALIKSDPNAFDHIWKEVAINNLDKVAELKAKAKKAINKEKVNAIPGSKSKSSAPASGELTPEKLKNMSFDEVEKLRKKGAFQVKND